MASGLDQPEGIALTNNGQLIVAEAGAKRVISMDPATGVSQVIADGLPIGAAPFAALGRPGQVEPFLPTGVAIVKSGDIYITSDIEHSVLRLSPH